MTTAYERKKASARERSRAQSAEGRDIGAIPPVHDYARRRMASVSFRAYCESYFPHRFALAWSDDHLKAIARIQDAVLNEGRFALAMPRGSGKTTLCEVAVMWAASIGRHEYVVLVGSCEDAATQMLDNIKAELIQNDLLLEDWPEICFPLRALEGQSRRCIGQLSCGLPTWSKWEEDRIVLPMIAGSRASSAVIRVAGVTGNLRGMAFTRPDGRKSRPTLAVLDDPQTDDSARSIKQCQQRERIILGAILGMAGPGRRVACLMPTTVIRKGDMSDRFLDREIHPTWFGERFKLLYEWPKRKDMWDQWWNMRREELAGGGNGAIADLFLIKNFDAMHAGSRVGWEQRYGSDEVSALHNCMAWHYTDPVAFACEGQNDPPSDEVEEEAMPPAKKLAVRYSGYGRGIVPANTDWLTCFIDVHKEALYWVVAGWSERGQGWIIDYGTCPGQTASYFTLSTVIATLQSVWPGLSLESQITSGLRFLTEKLMGHRWQTSDGGTRSIDRIHIDANWGEQTETVYEFCRRSPHAAVLSPSHGKFYGARTPPMSSYKRRPGERRGHHWLQKKGNKRALRYILVDTNFWKSFIAGRLICHEAQDDALTFYGGGDSGQFVRHDMLADHLRSEKRSREPTKDGRRVDEWTLKVGQDNHLLDGVVGTAVAASVLGLDPSVVAAERAFAGAATSGGEARHRKVARRESSPVSGGRRLSMAERQAIHRAKRDARI